MIFKFFMLQKFHLSSQLNCLHVSWKKKKLLFTHTHTLCPERSANVIPTNICNSNSCRHRMMYNFYITSIGVEILHPCSRIRLATFCGIRRTHHFKVCCYRKIICSTSGRIDYFPITARPVVSYSEI